MKTIYIDEKYNDLENKTTLSVLIFEDDNLSVATNQVKKLIDKKISNKKTRTKIHSEWKAKTLSNYKFRNNIVEIILKYCSLSFYVEINTNKVDKKFISEYNAILKKLENLFGNEIVIDKVNNEKISKQIIWGCSKASYTDSFLSKGIQFADVLLSNFLEPFKIFVL